MSLDEKKVFIQDEESGMSFEEKNLQLSAVLAIAPNSRRKIVRIDRIEIGGTGWWITYRVGMPD